MTPKEWARLTKKVLGAPIREHLTKSAVDLDYNLEAINEDGSINRVFLDNFQNALDLLPDVATIRLTLLARTVVTKVRKGKKIRVKLQTGTDETVENGIARRPTNPVLTSKGSDLIGRAFGPGGGYERLIAAYGQENVSKFVVVELRYPPEK